MYRSLAWAWGSSFHYLFVCTLQMISTASKDLHAILSVSRLIAHTISAPCSLKTSFTQCSVPQQSHTIYALHAFKIFVGGRTRQDRQSSRFVGPDSGEKMSLPPSTQHCPLQNVPNWDIFSELTSPSITWTSLHNELSSWIPNFLGDPATLCLPPPAYIEIPSTYFPIHSKIPFSLSTIHRCVHIMVAQICTMLEPTDAVSYHFEVVRCHGRKN